MVAIYTLTPNAAGQSLTSNGLSSLGLASLLLSSRWDDTTPGGGAYDANACTLTLGAAHAPFRAIREFTSDPSRYSDPTGAPLSGNAAVLRLHPEAVQRLERLAAVRYAAAGQPAVRPVPWAMVVREATGALADQWYEADEVLGLGNNMTVSFHDGRGLIIDPLAVAAMAADLLTALPGLLVAGAPAGIGGTGGVGAIAALGSGVRIHVVDPHGAAYQPAVPGATVTVTDNLGTVTATVGANGLADLPDNHRVAPAGTDGGRLRIGWGLNGTMDTAALTVPALPTGGPNPPALPRQFLRVCACDMSWHLIGNRTQNIVLGIPKDDGTMPTDLLPVVRDRVRLDFLTDGVDVLAAANGVLSRLTGAGPQGLIFAASPTLDVGVGLPPIPPIDGHWPGFPLPNTGTGFPPGAPSPTTGITSNWTGVNDVTVTIPAGPGVPDGAHGRIYPRRYVAVPSIGPELSFVRGDGGATIAQGGSPVSIRLPNPLGLADGQPRPSPATLVFDLVVAPRTGTRKLHGAVTVPIGTDVAAAVVDPFAVPDPMGPLLAGAPIFASICPVPLFGVPRNVTLPGGAPTGVVDLVRRLGSEGTPRQGPRLPTMGRLETIVVSGVPDGALAGGELRWQAVLTGGRWRRETRSTQHAAGNPGNPAGPDVHAPGVLVDGQLAYDLAFHAVRRAQPILPLPTSGGATPGWLVASSGNNFNPPPAPANDNDGAPPQRTGVGVLLETFPAICETPELSLADPATVPTDFNSLLNNVATALGLGGPPAVTATNAGRLVRETRREFYLSKFGARDAQWALRRAIQQARELVYVESAAFARTAHPSGPPAAHEVDLVAELVNRLASQPNLRVVIATPRFGDFDPRYGGWLRRAYADRTEAVDAVKGAAPSRVVIFHPVGFPGRAAVLRTSIVIIDDMWCLTGTSHWRRRGMTFDGGVDIVSFDRELEDGYSKKIRDFRRQRMAALLQVTPPTGTAPVASGDWLRLARPRPAFEAVADLLSQGGLGRIVPFWPGPSDNAVLATTVDIADPDGSSGASFVSTFAGLLAEVP